MLWQHFKQKSIFGYKICHTTSQSIDILLYNRIVVVVLYTTIIQSSTLHTRPNYYVSFKSALLRTIHSIYSYTTNAVVVIITQVSIQLAIVVVQYDGIVVLSLLLHHHDTVELLLSNQLYTVRTLLYLAIHIHYVVSYKNYHTSQLI